MRFFHAFGSEIHALSHRENGRICAYLSVPFIDYVGLLVASGILAAKYRSTPMPSSNPTKWMEYSGQSVSFPFEYRHELRRKVGTIEGVENTSSGAVLAVKYFDNIHSKTNGKRFIHYVKQRWLHSVQNMDAMPNLKNWNQGSQLAYNIRSLDAILGESGASSLVGTFNKDCLILDVKSRVSSEIKDSIALARLGYEETNESLILADIVRPTNLGPTAIQETFSSCISSEPEPGWDYTAICGSLNTIKHWDDCDSAVRIAILCSSDNAYQEALEFVNETYYQRVSDIALPESLLAIKPSIVDFQVISCSR